MAKPPAKKRPYDAMRDESSRAIDAMPYTEAKPKSKAKPAPKPAPKRSADWYMKNETAMPGKFKRGGSVKMAAGGSFSEAFRAARKAGKSDFSWNGKKYTTEMKGEAKTPPKATAPTSAPASTPAKPSRFSTSPSNRTPAPVKPEAPSYGQSNLAAYRRMMDESAAGQRKQAEADAAARAARTRAIRETNQKKDRDSMTDAAARAEEARKRAQATRNAVSGRPGQAKAKGGKIKAKKRYV